jgi:hypothetical protein
MIISKEKVTVREFVNSLIVALIFIGLVIVPIMIYVK